jgi:predicted RNA-binding Zn-ribbon protein involved in translation (DUF1610 family)
MDHSKQAAKKRVQATTYTCVMHPRFMLVSPECPKCGMALIKEKHKRSKKQQSK